MLHKSRAAGRSSVLCAWVSDMTDASEVRANAAWPLDASRTRLRFALRFIAIAAVSFAVYTFPYREAGISEGLFERYLELYAQAAGFGLSLFERGIHVEGTLIAGRYPLQIVKNCDAIEINILFASAVLAFPATLSQRVFGLVGGLVALVLLNLVRIGSLYFIGVHMPERFEAFHLEIWPLCLVAAASLLFLGYASWVQPQRSPRD
jgi:exosortase/archaeosortase family protein